MDSNDNLNQDNNSLNNQDISSNSNTQNNINDELAKEKLERIEAANDTKKVAGKSMQVAGKTAEVAGKGVETAGKGLSKASSAAGKAMSAIPVVGAPLGAVVGTAGNVAGKSMQLAGKGAQTAGKAANNAGKKAEDSANQNQNTNNTQPSASDALKKGAKKARNAVKNGVNNPKKAAKRKALNTVGRVAEKIPGIGTAIGVGRRAANLKNHLENKNNNETDKKDGENTGDNNNSKSITGRVKPKSTSVEGVVNRVVGKALKRKILSIVISVAIFLCGICIIIGAVWGPISWALEKLDRAIDTVANTQEKMDNFMNGLGFQNSEDAFAEELQKLDDEHDNELNIPLLMSALFYDDVHSNGEEGAAEEDEEDENSVISLSMAASYIESKIKESNETIGEDGLVYSSNKIYRLRKLARHMFDDEVFGNGCGKELKSEDISDYIDDIGERIGDTLFNAIKSFLLVGVNAANLPDFVESVTEVAKGEELFSTTDTGARLEDIKDSLIDLLKAIIAPFTNFESIRIAPAECTTSGICIDYYTYGFSKKTYVEYLKNYYVPNMPEFKKYIAANSDKERDKQVEKVVAEIVEEAANYEDVYGRQATSAESYTPSCQGNIDDNIIDKIVKPVKIGAGTVVKFKSPYSYGVSNGVKHNGLDLNSETTGNKEGDSVFSIAKGTVVGTTQDNSFKCDDCKENSGWIKIKYNIAQGKNKYTIYATYGGLKNDDPNFTKLKKDSKVNQNQIIGKIGSADVSDSGIAGLHFEIKDKKKDTNLNPTNLFIDCAPADGAGIKIKGSSEVAQVYNAIKDAAKSNRIDKRYAEDIQIAGILGNMQIESVGVHFYMIQDEWMKSKKEILALPDAINPERLGQSGGRGFGLIQWDGGRRLKLYKYATAQNKKWYDANVQLSFLFGEFNKNGGAKIGKTKYADYQWKGFEKYEKQLLNATNIEDAVRGYEHGFERCGDCHETERITAAKTFYKKIKNGDLSSDNYSDGGDATADTSEGAEDPTEEEEPNAAADTTKVVSSLDNFVFIGDSRIHGVSDKLSALGNNVQAFGLDSSTPEQWRKKIKGKMKKKDLNFTIKNGTGSINVSLPADKDAAQNFVIMLGVNATSQYKDLKKIYNRLHKNYPNSMIFAASVYPVGSNYKYGARKDSLNANIKELNDKIKGYAKKKKWLKYIDITDGLVESNGDLKSDYQDSEGLHLTGKGQDILVQNFQSKLVGQALLDDDDEATSESEDSCDNDIDSLFEYINVSFDDDDNNKDDKSRSSSSDNKNQTKMSGKSNSDKIKYVFPDGVPKSDKEMKKYLTTISVPITTKDGKKSKTNVLVHKKIAGDVEAALEAAQKEGFAVYQISGYRIYGSDTAGDIKDVGLNYSQHCYGLAVDINVDENCHKPTNGDCTVGKLWDPKNNKYSISKDTALYKSFISNGWGWGGDWSSSKDYMHFSFFGT